MIDFIPLKAHDLAAICGRNSAPDPSTVESSARCSMKNQPRDDKVEVKLFPGLLVNIVEVFEENPEEAD